MRLRRKTSGINHLSLRISVCSHGPVARPTDVTFARFSGRPAGPWLQARDSGKLVVGLQLNAANQRQSH
jgi:hypothetical protein